MILAQTPFPGLHHEAHSVSELTSFIAPKGAEMLVESIRKGVFMPPLCNVGWCGDEQGQKIHAAPKITTEDRRVQWQSWTADDILLRSGIIGPLFNIIPANENKKSLARRIIWTSGFEKSVVSINPDTVPGRPMVFKRSDSATSVAIPTCDGQFLAVRRAKVEGHRDDDILSAARRAKLFEAIDEASQGLQ